MSDDSILEEEVAREKGWTREQYLDVKLRRDWDSHERQTFMEGSAWLAGRAKTKDEFLAEQIDKELKKRRAKQAEEQDRIEGWLQVLHQGKGEQFYLRVMVDTGATVNAITYGMLIDYDLETQRIRLDKPHVLRLAVGDFECSEQISLQWMGKGNEVHDTATFYVLPRGQARVILSREWLNKRDLLFDRDPSPSLRPLIGGQKSESEIAAMERERQRALDDQAASSKVKDAYQKKGGQIQQDSSSTDPSQPKE